MKNEVRARNKPGLVTLLGLGYLMAGAFGYAYNVPHSGGALILGAVGMGLGAGYMVSNRINYRRDNEDIIR